MRTIREDIYYRLAVLPDGCRRVEFCPVCRPSGSFVKRCCVIAGYSPNDGLVYYNSERA